MATFPTPDRAVAAALPMRVAMRDLGSEFILKIGIHEGPCLAMLFNERQDYLHIPSTPQRAFKVLQTPLQIFPTRQVVGHSGSASLFASEGIAPLAKERLLRGIAAKIEVFEIQ